MISIIMSTFNGEQTLSKSIESILNQTYSEFEFIICDDCSTDNSWQIIKKYADNDNRIIPIKNTNNLGLQKSLNKCLNLTNGEFVARMDDDDYSKTNRLCIELKFLQNNRQYAFVGTNISLYSNNVGIYGHKKYPLYPSKIDMIKFCQFAHPTILIRSEVIHDVGGYSVQSDHYRVEDYELWLRLYSMGYIGANIQEELLIYNKDYSSILNTNSVDRINCYKLLKQYYKKLNIPKKYYIYIYIPLLKRILNSKLFTIVNYIKYHYF